jgi:hypothetical protein
MIKKVGLLSFVLAICLFATACPERTSIGNISANPSKYLNKDTAVAGRVTNSFGIARLGGIYKVDDGTGSIWVLTNKGVPSKGSQVGVRGEIQEGVTYGGKTYGLGMTEKERKFVKR